MAKKNKTQAEWYELARERVYGDADLETMQDFLLYDWDQPEHYEWVATAPKAELMGWSQTVAAQ